MSDKLEEILLSQHGALYSAIKQKAVNELSLPMDSGASLIGFGKYLNFYMFWITERKGTLCFSTRIRFEKAKADNTVRLEFTDKNKGAILAAINTIYESYSIAKTEGRIAKERAALAEKGTLRATMAKNKEGGSPSELLWNEVTVSVLEKLEQTDTSSPNKNEFRLREIGTQLCALFDQILDTIIQIPFPTSTRRISIIRDCIQADKTALAAIGIKYGVSRERIRQIANRAIPRLYKTFRQALLLENETIDACIHEAVALLAQADYDVVSLAVYGLNSVSEQKKEALFSMFFGETAWQSIKERYLPLAKEEHRCEEILQKEEDLHQQWTYYQSRICFPASFVAETESVERLPEELTYSYERTLRNRLKRFEVFLDIIERPDIIFYSSLTTDHRPQFLLRLPDGRSVLVLVLPTVNLALIYNVKRFNELHRFCQNNGYGYLILDNADRSIYEIQSKTIDAEVVSRLNAVLREKEAIGWEDIQSIKKDIPISNLDLAAYVLQNKLYFTKTPFVIKRRP